MKECPPEVKIPADITLPLPGGRDYITLNPFTDGPGSWDLVGPHTSYLPRVKQQVCGT